MGWKVPKAILSCQLIHSHISSHIHPLESWVIRMNDNGKKGMEKRRMWKVIGGQALPPSRLCHRIHPSLSSFYHSICLLSSLQHMNGKVVDGKSEARDKLTENKEEK